MRKNLLWLAIVITAALIQTTWLDTIRLQGVLPDLTLLIVVYFAVVDGEERAMFTGLLGGIYQDVAGEAVLGHHVLCNVVAAYVVGRVSRRLVLDHPVVKVGLVFCASLLHGMLYLCIEYVQSPALPALHRLVTSVVPGSFYNTLVTPIVFGLLAALFARRQDSSVQGGLA